MSLEGAVNSDELRRVCGRIFWQACRVRRKERVARGVGPHEITGEGYTRNGCDTARVQVVTLNHDRRATKPWA